MRVRTRARVRGPAALLTVVLLSLVWVPLVPGGPVSGAVAQSYERTIEVDDYWYTEFNGAATDTLKVEAWETLGRPFDLFMMKEYMLDDYKEALSESGEIRYYPKHSRLNTYNVSFSQVMPNPGGKFFILIDNTEAPDGGAYANSSLQVTLIISLEKAAPGAGLVGAGLTLGLTGLLWVRRWRR